MHTPRSRVIARLSGVTRGSDGRLTCERLRSRPRRSAGGEDPRRTRPAWAPSAWATWGCPLSVEFAAAGLPVTGFDLAAEKVDAVNAATSYIKDVPTERLAALVRAGRLRRQRGLRRLGRVRRGHHLRAHAAQQDQGPRPLHGRGGRASRSPRACGPGQLVVLESTTYPGTTEELILPLLAERGLKVGESLLPGLLARARGPGQRRASTRATRPRSSAASPPPARAWRRRSTRKAIETVDPRLLHARRRDGQAAGEHVPQREHRPGERGGAHVRPAGRRRVGGHRRRGHQAVRLHALLSRARAWAGTASPSTPSTSPGSSRPSTTAPASSSWPARSTPRCPSTSCERVADALNDREKSVKGSRVLVLGVAYKRDVDDVRESPALDILPLLREPGRPRQLQ